MAAPFSTPILDSGTGAAGVLPNPPWTGQNLTNMQYDGSGHIANPGGGRGQDYYNALGPFTDCESYLTVTTFNDFSLVGVRNNGSTGSVNGYYAQASSGGMALVRWDANTANVLDSVTFPLSNGDKIGCRAIGSLISSWAFQGGVWSKISEVTDATYSSGFLAIQQGLTVGRLDDFGGGAVASTADPTLGMIHPIARGRFA